MRARSSQVEALRGTETETTAFSPTVLALCWCCFVTLHTFCLLYFASVAWFYWHLAGTSLDRWLFTYSLGLGPEFDRIIAAAHACVGGIHFGYLLWMVMWSLKERQLVFAVYDVFVKADAHEAKKQFGSSITDFVRGILAKIVIVGVDGPYFDVILLGREIVEAALQTQQAYRMSLLLPRAELNRCYSALLVLNCWATALVETAFHENATKRRFFAIVCDCTLDLVTSVGVSVVLISIYFPDYDFRINDFPERKWYEDVWLVHAISEFKVLLVTSLGDLIMRMIYALSMLINMNNMKKLLSTTSSTTGTNLKVNHRVAAVVPLTRIMADVHLAFKLPSKLEMVIASVQRLSRLLFSAWGIVVLVLHLYAESIPGILQCGMQIKPWFNSKPSCSLLLLDCYGSNFVGNEDEITAQWSSVDPDTVACLVVRHCPNLEVSDKLTEFSGLKILKFYNSTITNWSKRAAISQVHHPNLIMLFLVRVNMTNGELPAGLNGDNFPRTLRDIECCNTNLHTLPEDFDLKWPQSASMYLEACNFTEVPPSLARLRPFDLSLAYNPISHLPATLFEGGIVYLHIGGTSVSELPENVNDVLPLVQLRVDNTDVAFFWNWIDPMVDHKAAVLSIIPYTVVASHTPYCQELQRIYQGEQTNFAALYHKDQSLILSNASTENWSILKNAVSCDEWPKTWYPIHFEDVYSGIK
ncbi:unnamed protein product [Phytophthora lilii]|uniref:Unnamed protein product n=1 Tax=Phytophthora lilii TaxID=2077276 RepID=A0A9W6UC75_9STRA|nr:unnamed protein product [Phytophthora lilii]